MADNYSIFAQSIKQVLPNTTDDDVKQLYDTSASELAARNVNLSTLPPDGVAKVAQAVGAHAAANGGKINDKELGKYSNKDAYAGTSQQQNNPIDPQAAALSQYDPKQVNNAYNQQQGNYDKLQMNRNNMGLVAAMGGGKLVEDQRARDLEQNKLQTTGRQEALQQAGTQGLAAAGQIQTQQTNQIELAHQQRMNDPSSAETLLAKQIVASQIGQIPGVDVEQVKSIISKPGVTAAQIMPVLGLIPGAQDAYLKATTNRVVTQATSPGNTGGMIPTINVGGVSLSNPGAHVAATTTATNQADANENYQRFKSEVYPQIDRAIDMLNSGTYTGMGAEKLAGKLQSSDQAQIQRLIESIKSLHPEMASRIDINMNPAQLRQALHNIKTDVDNEMSSRNTTVKNVQSGQVTPQVQHPVNEMPRPKTKAEANALPPGTKFVDPNGTVRVR